MRDPLFRVHITGPFVWKLPNLNKDGTSDHHVYRRLPAGMCGDLSGLHQHLPAQKGITKSKLVDPGMLKPDVSRPGLPDSIRLGAAACLPQVLPATSLGPVGSCGNSTTGHSKAGCGGGVWKAGAETIEQKPFEAFILANLADPPTGVFGLPPPRIINERTRSARSLNARTSAKSTTPSKIANLGHSNRLFALAAVSCILTARTMCLPGCPTH